MEEYKCLIIYPCSRQQYAFDDNNIMSFISKLRKKIKPDAEHPFYILTVHGVGYRFNKEA
jgi:DNA-binding response OmpR family regulator